MALPATDTFTAADGTVLTTYSANWTNNLGSFIINTNSLAANGSSDCGAHWDADAFNADQYSQATVVAISSQGIGVAVRCSTAATANYYMYYGNVGANSGEIGKIVGGAFTGLGSARTAFAVNDVLRLEIAGTTITAYRNSVQQGTTQTDSSHATGAAGVSGYVVATTSRIDSWEGGNLGGAATTAPPIFRSPMRHMLVR